MKVLRLKILNSFKLPRNRNYKLSLNMLKPKPILLKPKSNQLQLKLNQLRIKPNKLRTKLNQMQTKLNNFLVGQTQLNLIHIQMRFKDSVFSSGL